MAWDWWPFNKRDSEPDDAMSGEHDKPKHGSDSQQDVPVLPVGEATESAEAIPVDEPGADTATELPADPMPAEQPMDVQAERAVDELIQRYNTLTAALATAQANSSSDPAALEDAQRDLDDFRTRLALTNRELDRYRAACERIRDKANDAR